MGYRMHKRMRNDGKFYCMLDRCGVASYCCVANNGAHVQYRKIEKTTRLTHVKLLKTDNMHHHSKRQYNNFQEQ